MSFYTKEFAGLEFIIGEDGKLLTDCTSLGMDLGEYPHDATEILSEAMGRIYRNSYNKVEELKSQQENSYSREDVKKLFRMLDNYDRKRAKAFIENLDVVSPSDMLKMVDYEDEEDC